MPLATGTRLGAYEVLAPLGQGGMGEVYKATDTRLNRTVAIKVLPAHFAHNPDMKQRFDREAQTIAALNHPNICTLYDVGSDNGTSYLVMEFVEGETLADRIARGVIDLDDAIRIAAAIADALDKAHRKGVIHRDLKPANVMLGKSGGAAPLVKLLDFGLAKWVAPDAGSLDLMQTRTSLSTPGMILGTLQYMAPEQVEGQEADARTDIFGFGAVVYEMIAGRRAFQGKSQATLISAIMASEPPPLTEVLDAAPGPTNIKELDHVIRRCLAKDPEDRWQDAHSLLVKLRWIGQGRTEGAEGEAPAPAPAVNHTRARTMRIALAAAAVLIVVLSVPASLYVRGPNPPEAFPMRVPVVGGAPNHFSVAPNGREIAIVAQPEGQESTALYVRRVDAPVFRKLPGTEGAVQPFWSPDSHSVAFVSGGKLKRADATGGAPRDIAAVTEFSGGTWSKAGTILFGSGKGLFRVPAEGGTPELITQIDISETGHFWPAFLPDDVHYLFSVWSDDPSRRAVYVGALESKDRTRLMAGETNAVYAAHAGGAASGYLLFHRQASLVAQAFDAGSRALSGVDGQVAGGLAFSAGDGRGSFSASANGVLVFHQGTGTTGGRGRTGLQEFAWVTRTGEQTRLVVAADQHGDMDLSGDQRFMAITKLDAGTPASDIWVVDIEKGNSTRLTLDPADDLNPVWSPKGDQIAFTSYRAGNADIFVKNANGVGPDTPLVQTAADEFVEGWSRDGRHLAYVAGRESFQDIHVLPLEGDRKPVTVVQGPYRADEPQFSYDGKWLAYTSDESAPGKFEVYVVSFPGLDQKRKISVDGGGQPRWRRDGRELFYRTVAGYMAVEFLPGANVDSGVPRLMFPTLTGGGGNLSSSDPTRHQWAAAPDGERFLVRMPVGRIQGMGRVSIPSAARMEGGRQGRGGRGGRGQSALNLTVILHWPASLGKAGK